MKKIKENTIHHYMGIELNFQTWKLLEKVDRNDNDDIKMNLCVIV